MKMNAYTARQRLLAGLLAGGMLLAAGTAANAIDYGPIADLEYEPTADLQSTRLKALIKRAFETPAAPGAASVVAQMGRRGSNIVFDAGDGLAVNNIVFDAGDGIYKGPDWAAGLQLSQLGSAVADQIEYEPTANLRLDDTIRSLHLVRALGSLRYTNHARQRSNVQPANEQVARQQALDLAVRALAALGLPRTERGDMRIDDRASSAMLQVVTADRRINGLPVLGSRARVAVTGQGSIQRLDLGWPRFRMAKGLRLLSPEAVLDQVTSEIQKRQPGAGIKLQSQLVYAPANYTLPPRAAGISAEDDWEVPVSDTPPEFVPSVLVSVQTGRAAYQVLVPVVTGR